MRPREGGVGQQIVLGIEQRGGDVGEPAGQAVGYLAQMSPGGVGVGLGEDRADGRDDHLAVRLADPGQDVAREMHPADSHCQPNASAW